VQTAAPEEVQKTAPPSWLVNIQENWMTIATALAVVLLAYAVLRTALSRLFTVLRKRQEGRPGAEQGLAFLKDLEGWLHTALLLASAAGAVFGVVVALGYGPRALAGLVVEWLLSKGLHIVVILFLAFLASRALRFLVAQFALYLRRRGERSRDEEVRFKTLTDILTGGGSVVIAVVSTFLILETVLQSVGTILASVGFLGIAVGFGAQSLVKDLISGFFILLENQMALGDGVRINDLWGSVERIGLRTTTLRDSEGIVHFIPNGNISRVSNSTKGWSRAVVHVVVDYAADPDKVFSALKAVAREVQAEERFKGVLLGEMEVSGPESFEDGVLYRIAGPTVPTRQWEVMREIRLRLWKTLAREGIAIKKSPLYSAAGKVE
jgi:small-conductance mechanosensitive channel